MRPLSFAALLAIASLALAASPAAAAEVQCEGLQQAFTNSVEGDVITLSDGQVCHGSFTLPLNRAITFQGTPGGEPEIMDGDNEVRILYGDDVGATLIRGLTFQNGSHSGSGAAIKIKGDSAPTLSNLKIIDNESGDRGPVTIATDGGGGTVTVEDSTFDGNGDFDGTTATQGGGLLIDTVHAIVLENNSFIGNVAGQIGGGAVLRADDTIGDNDRAQGDVEVPAPVTITDNTFSGNRVAPTPNDSPVLLGGGLAILVDTPGFREVVQSGNTFSDNAILPSFFVGDRTTEGGNFGGYFAGGGEYTQTSVDSTNDRFVENSIEEPEPQETIIQDGNFNNPVIRGGGLAISSGDNNDPELTLEARNLVVAGNEIAFGEGGGISSDGQFLLRAGALPARDSLTEGEDEDEGPQGTTLLLLDSTIYANDAGDGTGSGIYGNYNDDLVVRNGIVFDNKSSQGRQIDGFGDGGTKAFEFTDYCAEQEQSVPALAPPTGEGNICADPQLVDPPNGDVRDVHQKAGLSPTIDVGSNGLVPPGLTTDWDRPTGDPRIAGARVDMGADEIPVAPPATVTPTPPAPPAGAVLGAQQRSCVSRREFRIRLRVPRGKTAVSATVRVNGKQVKVVRGRRLRAPVILRGLPKGKITVKISIRLKGGKRITGTRRYNTCIPRLPGDGPPPV